MAKKMPVLSNRQLTIIHKLNNKIIHKVLSDQSYIYSVQAIKIKAKTYNHLGRHKQIAKCIRCGDNYINLCYKNLTGT